MDTKFYTHQSFNHSTAPMEEEYTLENALVQFIYRELPANEAVFMSDMIDQDEDLQELFYALLQAKSRFPKVTFNPSETAIQNLLQYSTKTAMEAHL